MRKFKVGDEVQVTEDNPCSSDAVMGKKYYITEVSGSSFSLSSIKGQDQTVMWVYRDYIKPWADSSPVQIGSLPKDAAARKAIPIYSGLIRYFPLALIAVAELSKIGNDQHNPGQPIHWDRNKSGDELDALMRHLLESGSVDVDGVRHSTKIAWRALANLQKELEDSKESAEIDLTEFD